MEKAEPSQAELGQFVHNHILNCQSSLIEHLFQKGVFMHEDISNLYSFVCPECGNTQQSLDDFETPAVAEYLYSCPSCEKEYDDEPEMEAQEILEWWICDSWLIDKLQEHGEPILHTDYGSWWGRTCSGQAILLDNVISDIYQSIS